MTGPAGQPGTGEASQWAAHPFAGSLAEARTRIETVAGWAAARKNGARATAGVIDAAVVTLAVPPDRRDVSVTVRPAVVWDIGGYKVLVWDAGPPGEPGPYAECSCGRWDGPCEHLLVALAGTEQPSAAAETVRLLWHNAHRRLENDLIPGLAEALLISARAHGYAAISVLVTADPERLYAPDEFEVGPAPAAQSATGTAARPVVSARTPGSAGAGGFGQDPARASGDPGSLPDQPTAGPHREVRPG